MAKLRSKKSTKRKAWMGKAMFYVGIVVFLCLLHGALKYTYVSTFFPFWPVALCVGLLCGVLFSVMFFVKERRIGKSFGIFILLTVMSFVATVGVIEHLNHAFDSGNPQRYAVVIEDKTSHKRGKHHGLYSSLWREYEFTLTVNGDTFDINVPRSHYRKYEEGDLYVVEYHEGAFNEPYFLAVGGVSQQLIQNRTNGRAILCRFCYA